MIQKKELDRIPSRGHFQTDPGSIQNGASGELNSAAKG